jgi:hypothetical protein
MYTSRILSSVKIRYTSCSFLSLVIVAFRFASHLHLPSLATMRIMSTRTIIILHKSRFSLTAPIMILLPITTFQTRNRINVNLAKFLATLPAPRSPTTRTNHEFTRTRLESTGKNVIASRILESPACTPRTLLCVHLPGYTEFKYVVKRST